MIAEIITIGDELLRGEIIDSNKAHLAEQLLDADVQTRFQTSVCDAPADMRDAFLRAAGRAQIVLVSGGLGPTRDDVTVATLAETFGRPLQQHGPSLENLRAFFARFGRQMSPSNEQQTWFPEGAEVLPNPVGTAPGCMLQAPGEGGALFFCMPGVPRELKLMLAEQVLPRVAKAKAAATGEAAVVRHCILRTFGIGESTLEDELRAVARDQNVQLGFRTTFPDNFLRPVARGKSEAEAQARLQKTCQAIEEKLGALVYGRDEETMAAVVGRLLCARGQTVAVAESCTGGMLGAQLTAAAGASAYFRGGVLAYANAAKQKLLGVPAAVLEGQGAVSGACAEAMAQGARAQLQSSWALSVTGIAGPEGGSEEKPAGTVWIGCAGPGEGQSFAADFQFPFDRERNRQLAVQMALDILRRTLLGEPHSVPRWMNVRGRGRSGGAGARA